jgi:transporter family protein
MNYLPLALITMVLLGLHYFLAKIISPHMSSTMIALIACVVCVPVLVAYIYFAREPVIPEQKIYLFYAILIGVPLAIGILTIYIALARGPVSVVMPIYGLNAMVTVLLGIVFLHEAVSVPKVLGLILAVAAIILLSR